MALIRRQRPNRPETRHAQGRQILAQELKGVAKAAERSRQKIVADWENQPTFEAVVVIEPDMIRVVTRLGRPKKLKDGNANTNDLWTWIDQTGTRPHTIRPKRPSGVLAFQGGKYQSKTGARPPRYGGPGTVSNPQAVYTRRVQHPGFPPRHFTRAIDKDVKREFNNAIQRARRKAAKVI